ncbi:MAG TPA: PEP-utilizing enzyme [Acidimicrobiales bacterium]|nr:PEP-utilizing enzyme [Acidimicrobiales bacterium]
MTNTDLQLDLPPGSWSRSTAHFRLPLSALLRSMWSRILDEAMGRLGRSYGIPIDGVDVHWLHGYPFMQMRVMADLSALGERAAVADEVLATRAWRADAERWSTEGKPRWIAANLVLQDVHLPDLDDAALVGHLAQAVDHAVEAIGVHFELHAADQIPVGDFLVACERWGIDDRDAATALSGASPASIADSEELAMAAQALAASADEPRSLDEVRSHPEAGPALKRHLRSHGWRVVTSYDVDGQTEGELPDLTLRSLRRLMRPEATRPQADDGPVLLRARVPAADRVEFDDLLTEARFAYGLRDDHVGVDFLWPMGLLRRVLLEVGRRLVIRGLLNKVDLAIELAPDEVAGALGGSGPSSVELASRREERHRAATLGVPTHIGPVEEPPFDLLPPGLGRVMRSFSYASDRWYAPPGRIGLEGDGIGDRTVRGRARVVHDAAEALRELVDGEVLVAQFTTPAFNPALICAGALVTSEGGLFAHAAIAARELGLPAVIGAPAALVDISTGDLVEVDARSGLVRVVEVAR